MTNGQGCMEIVTEFGKNCFGRVVEMKAWLEGSKEEWEKRKWQL